MWEWNEALISGSSRGLRGGSYISSSDDMASFFRLSFNPANGDDQIGFRVASVPEPSTFVLGALGILGMLAFARQRTLRAGALSANQGLATPAGLG